MNWLIFELAWSIVSRVDAKIKTVKMKINGILSFCHFGEKFAPAKKCLAIR